MAGTITYPFSRTGTRRCPACGGRGGNDLIVAPSVTVIVGGNDLRLLRYVCDYCGFTMLFDMEMAKRRSWQGDDRYSEFFPDD